MKKNKIVIFSALTMLIILLSACTQNRTDDAVVTPTAEVTQAVTATPVPTATPAPTATPTPTPTPVPTIRDTFTETDEPGIYKLAEYTTEEVGPVDSTVFGDRIVVSYSDNETYDYMLRLVDPKTGELTDKKFEYSGYGAPYFTEINDELFAFYDYEECMFYLFDETLTQVGSYEAPNDDGSGTKLLPDGKSAVYIDSSEKALIRLDCETGESEIVCENEDFEYCYVSGLMADGQLVQVSNWSYYVDYSFLLIDLSTGEVVYEAENIADMEVAPDFSQCVISSTIPYSLKAIQLDATDPFTGIASQPAVDIAITSTSEPYGFLVDWDNKVMITELSTYSSSNNIFEYRCYSLDTGELLSSATFSEGIYFYSPTVSLFPDEGIAVIDAFIEGSLELFAWDYLNDDIEDVHRSYTRRGAMPGYLDDYRKELEEKYDIYIYLGSEVFGTDFDYRLTRCDNYELMYETLETLDEVLGIYPEGFLDQLKFDGIRTLGIYLVDGFTKASDGGIDDAIGLAMDSYSERCLALDVNWMSEMKRTIVHEISHWIDRKIESAAYFGYCEDYEIGWTELNPDDFYYKYSYVSGKTFWDYNFDEFDLEDSYFIDGYSQTYPTEDRARLFEHLIYGDAAVAEAEAAKEAAEAASQAALETDDTELNPDGLGGDGLEDGEDADEYEYEEPDPVDYYQAPHFREKLEYYFASIREAFDTAGWPEQTVWEERLAAENEKYKIEEEPVEADAEADELP